MKIQTLDGGEMLAGYWGSDTSKVMLGELPAMNTQQFAGYAAITLAQGIIPDLDPDTKKIWTTEARDLYDTVKDVPITRITSTSIIRAFGDVPAPSGTTAGDGSAEHNAMLGSGLVPAKHALFYRKNPFLAQPGRKRVDFIHENAIMHMIDREDFFSLTYRIIRGDIVGWTADGAEPGVVEAAQVIHSALAPSI